MLRPHGMTLLEVLVAVSVTAMMTGLIYGSFSRLLETPGHAYAIQARGQKVRSSMNRMAREISMAFLSRHQGPEKNTQTIFKLEDLSPVSRLTFTAFAHVRLYEDTDESDQTEITYFGREDREDKRITNLMKREARRIDEKPEEGGTAHVLADNVQKVVIEAWNGEEWVREWDSSSVEEANRIPERVRISLTVEDEQGEPRTYLTQARIFLSKPIGF